MTVPEFSAVSIVAVIEVTAIILFTQLVNDDSKPNWIPLVAIVGILAVTAGNCWLFTFLLNMWRLP